MDSGYVDSPIPSLDGECITRFVETNNSITIIGVNTVVFWDFFILFFIFIPLMIAWIYTVIDIFQRPDVGALGKFGWLMLVLFLPIIGMLIYFIARPDEWEIVV